jgi:hypothetical protein
MIATSNPPVSPRAEFFRSSLSCRVSRVVRWLLPTALLALLPKCLFCLAAYAGLGAALGLGGPEMCGASAGSSGSWASSLAWLGVGLGASALVAGVRCFQASAERTH